MGEASKYDVIETDVFKEWHKGITNPISHQIITAQILKLENGNFANTKSLKNGLYEVKIKKGAGFRLYFVNVGTKLIVLLCGGDKSSQQADIKTARKMAKEIR
ncbi:MAG: type II toxin-antitoxin system RelE/ParE family toxin [Treponema sp.]|nr:type II toxin-antitoxin system RelE/ParE family toxin [Treponema sp.]